MATAKIFSTTILSFFDTTLIDTFFICSLSVSKFSTAEEW